MLAKTQYELPVITNEQGDTISYQWPIPDSLLCIKDEIIIKFRPEALFLDRLCFEYTLGPPVIGDPNDEWHNYQKTMIMAQQFTIDTLIADPALREAIRSYGGIYLTRITSASPCTDTISITRSGNIIGCDDYLWMVLKLNNDTSLITACINLTISYQNAINLAQPNFCYNLQRDPTELNGDYGSKQLSLYGGLSGFNRAWDFQTGSYNIKVGVIDNGLDYHHCDLGKEKGLGKKVVGGWSWTRNSPDFSQDSYHGTPVAGIIGALTNGTGYGCTNAGVAGIAGGWQTENKLGSQLFGFQVGGGDGRFYTKFIISAIREASSNNPGTGYGYGINILNNSYGGGTYDESVRAAVNYAFENGVSFVAARGNYHDDRYLYPACYDDAWVTSVGGGDRNRNRIFYSNYGKNMDLIAPAGYCGDPSNQIVWTTSYPGSNHGYECFDGTSAATPHVSGLYALLRSEALEKGWSLEPEDYEGMVKASCNDRIEADNEYYRVGYDTSTGWGHLQANTLFNMLNYSPDAKYRVSHFSSNNIIFGNWDNHNIEYYFYRDGKFPKPLVSGLYTGRRREVWGTISLPTDKWLINDNTKLYVWGRSGQGTSSGYSMAEPNYQTGFTRVTTGTGGNGFVAGIIHNQSLDVSVISYQYDLYDSKGKYMGHIPPDSLLAFNISVFGLELTTSSVKNDASNNQMSAFLFPNPTNGAFTLAFSLNSPSNVQFQLYNYLGEQIFESETESFPEGLNKKEIDVSSFESGVYYCKLITSSDTQYLKFIVVK
ncbi:MAG: S8/S53 family peptidase [Chloroherpetonaceae bacterium]